MKNDEFCVNYLADKCREIENNKSEDMAIQTVNAFERVLEFANLGRKEGLLALEEACENLDMNDETQAVFFDMMQLVVDGTDPGLVERIGMNKCISMNFSSYQGLMILMYVQGSLMIQAGDMPRIIEELLRSMMPKSILNELKKRDCEGALPKAIEEVESKQNLIEDLCNDGKEIDEKDHSIISETAKALIMISDKDVQRLLRDTDLSTLTVAMKGLPGKARAGIFRNMSSRLATMVAEDMTYMGPVRLRDVEEECVRMMKTLIKLSDIWEIGEYDLSILKVVIDMYDCAEKENKALRDKYKELRSIINKIYND